MPLIESLLLLLVLSRVLGEVAVRFRQPSMIGEIAAGVLLGPSVLHAVSFTPEISAIANIGVLMLVFMAGMEMDMGALWESFRGRGAWVSAAGFLVPLVGGMLVGWLFGLDPTRTIFIGLCVAITALPVSVRILMDLDKLQTHVGQRIISAAVANDVLSLLALGVILDVKGTQGTSTLRLLESIGLAFCKALLFMTVVFTVVKLVRRFFPLRIMHTPTAFDKLLARLRGKESAFAIVLLFVIAFASFSQALGLDFVVGAFFGSMLLSHQVLGRDNFERVEMTASNVTMGFLGPIFFAAIGLEFDSSTLRDWKLTTSILAVSFAGKILGGYLGGRLARMGKHESWILGMGLNGRGVMELVIANIALTNGFIGQQLFTILVLMAVTTTLVTPTLLDWAYRRLPVGELEAEKTPELAEQ
ncbi:MAG TPA: cation:proton antiporter [Terracidiphilus sp.]|nr:cation:proton antiporter [Terracidiphilus sp.]